MHADILCHHDESAAGGKASHALPEFWALCGERGVASGYADAGYGWSALFSQCAEG